MEIKQLDPPLASEYLQWRANPVTKFLVQALFNKRELLKEGLAEGHGSTENLHVLIGRTQGIKDSVEYILSDFEYIEETDNSETE